jgi:3-oxoacyl-[acyl-carrier protein] reductase
MHGARAGQEITADIEAKLATMSAHFLSLRIATQLAASHSAGAHHCCHALLVTALLRWAINVTSVGTAVRAAAKYLLANPTGRIINIGSMLGETVFWPNIADYSATKSALLSYTKGWARDFAGKNITVNLIQPGPVETDANPSDGSASGSSFMAASPAGRQGQPEEVAAAVLFVASPAASFVNAAVLTVDGGASA